jgi:hypothetical protein
MENKLKEYFEKLIEKTFDLFQLMLERFVVECFALNIQYKDNLMLSLRVF